MHVAKQLYSVVQKGRGMVMVFASLVLILSSCDPLSFVDNPEAGLGSADLNPGRGYHQWRGQQVVPPHKAERRAAVVYQRFEWYHPIDDSKRLERAKNVYDFSAIRKLFDDNPNSLIAFRIRSFVDYREVYVPPYLRGDVAPFPAAGWWADTSAYKDGSQSAFVPDWNSEAYLDGVERLFAALAADLALPGPDGRPRSARLAWIDVGMYGQYGEWHLQTKVSGSSLWIDYSRVPSGSGIVPLAAMDANDPANPRRRLVDAQLKAFPQAQWVMFFLWDNREVLDYLFYQQSITTKPVGWRFDALGKSQFLYDQWENNSTKLAYWEGTQWGAAGSVLAEQRAFKNRWRSAPVVAEFYGSQADLAEALIQLRRYHIDTVSNGNFSSTSGSESVQWAAQSLERKNSLVLIGRNAGWRFKVLTAYLEVLGSGSARTLRYIARVQNEGTAPLRSPAKLVLRLSQAGSPERLLKSESQSLWQELAPASSIPAPPGEARDVQLDFALPADLGPGFWSVAAELELDGVGPSPVRAVFADPLPRPLLLY